MPAPYLIGGQVVRVAASGWPRPMTLINGGGQTLWIGQTYAEATEGNGLPLFPGAQVVWDEGRSLYASCATGTSTLYLTENTGQLVVAPVDTQSSGGRSVTLAQRLAATTVAEDGWSAGPFDMQPYEGFELWVRCRNFAAGILTRSIFLWWLNDELGTQYGSIPTADQNVYDVEIHNLYVSQGKMRIRGRVKAPTLLIEALTTGTTSTDLLELRGLLRMPEDSRVNRYQLDTGAGPVNTPTVGTISQDGSTGVWIWTIAPAGLAAGTTAFAYVKNSWSGPAVITMRVNSAVLTNPVELSLTDEGAVPGGNYALAGLPPNTVTRSDLSRDVFIHTGNLRVNVANNGTGTTGVIVSIQFQRHD